MAEKRLCLEVAILKELLHRGHDFLHWTDTRQMISDCLTKQMPSEYLRERLAAAQWGWKADMSITKREKQKKSLEELQKRVEQIDLQIKSRHKTLKDSGSSGTGEKKAQHRT
jgi:hypothetical protein